MRFDDEDGEVVLHPPRLPLGGAAGVVHAPAQHQQRARVGVRGGLAVAAVVAVGEEARPVDLPVVHDRLLCIGLAVDDDALRGVGVPAQPELGHVELHRQELVRAHVVKISIHFIFVVSWKGKVGKTLTRIKRVSTFHGPVLPSPHKDVFPLDEGSPVAVLAGLAVHGGGGVLAPAVAHVLHLLVYPAPAAL